MSDAPKFERFACWFEPSARSLLTTEALEGHEAEFMATHVPITDFEVAGSEASDLPQEARHESRLLQVISAPARRHAFVVIEGEPGSGKSHLIRWLKVQWPHERDLVVMVQRADGSLDGTLQQLRAKLPEEFQGHTVHLGSARKASLIGRARDFHTTLANSMEPDYFEQALPDAKWCDEQKIATILSHALIREKWKAPKRVFDIVSGERKELSQVAHFTIDDALELAQLEREWRAQKGAGFSAMRFMRKLSEEAELYQREADRGASSDQVDARLGGKIENLRKLVHALNARMNDVMQNLLGMSSKALKDLFRGLRLDLKKAGRRLVLLLEDITNFQGVDEQLIDVLVTKSETREDDDLCDLVSVAGITPAYFQEKLVVLGNVRDRITHHVRLSADEASDSQRVFGLKSAASQAEFAAQYLRAARIPKGGLTSWYQVGGQLPNRCDDCQFKLECHSGFGAVNLGGQAVGLYPFTLRSVHQMFGALRDPRGGRVLQTPRGMIQGVLSPTLFHPEQLEGGSYPAPEIQTSWLPETDKSLALKLLLDQRVDNQDVRDRLWRTIDWWGDPDDASVTRSETGAMQFASVPQVVFNAFGLPWLGDSSGVAPSPIRPTPEAAKPAESEESRTGSRSADQSSSTSDSPSKEDVAPVGPARKKRSETAGDTRKGVRRVRVQEAGKRQAQIAEWEKGGSLEDSPFWNQQLFALLDGLPWLALGIPLWIKQRLFTQDSVMLEGTGKADDRHFVVARDPSVVSGLGGYVVLQAKDRKVADEEFELHRRMVVRLIRHLTDRAQEHVSARIPRLGNGEYWSIVGTLTQVLLMRAWLRDAITPEAPTWKQWHSVLLPEPNEPATHPESRTARWSEILDKTARQQQLLKDLLRRFVSLPQGSSQDFGVADTVEAARAIRCLQGDPIRILRAPEGKLALTKNRIELEGLAQVACEVNTRFPDVPKAEHDRLLRSAERVETNLGGASVAEFIRETDTFVQRVFESLQQTVATKQAEWAVEYRKAREFGLTDNGPSARKVEEYLDFLYDGHRDRSTSLTTLELLAHSKAAPTSELKRLLECQSLAESILQELLRHVERVTKNTAAGAPTSLSQVHAAGTRVSTAATNLVAAIEASSE